MAKVLITGGAGYVGSTFAAGLIDRKEHEVWVVDDLSTGHLDQVRAAGVTNFVRASIGDQALLAPLFERERFDAVVHFAGLIAVSESVAEPKKYWDTNYEQTVRLLDTMAKYGVKRFIFSSTCAVFGTPQELPIRENFPKKPESPYGQTKLAVEELLEKLATERGLSSIILRYFNACGAEPRFRVGERHEPETHVIPSLLRAMLEGNTFRIFGGDYPTPDGTAIRDYVHVWDLARAHLHALERLLSGDQGCQSFNLGSERGISVSELVESATKILGSRVKSTFKIEKNPRRPGDVSALVADSARARQDLCGWRVERGLDEIMVSAAIWEMKMMQSANKAVFLDRDGTINFDPGYIKNPEDLRLLEGSAEGMRRLREAGYRLVIVTNQSGVGRGFFTEDDLARVHQRLDELLRAEGVKVDFYSVCIHRPEAACACRKPSPKLLLDGALAVGIDPSQSYMVGDKLLDLDAGWNAGCKASILVRTGWGEDSLPKLRDGQAAHVAPNLLAAADWILQRNEASLKSMH